MLMDLIQMVYYPTDSCAGASTDGEWDCKIGCRVEMNFYSIQSELHIGRPFTSNGNFSLLTLYKRVTLIFYSS